MPNQDYMPTDDEGKAALFERFRDTIGSHATSVGLTPLDITTQANDANWTRHTVNRARSMRDCGSQWVSYKNNLFDGSGTAAVPGTPPPADPEPDPVNPGVVPRFRDLVRRIKAAPGYTAAIGEALGIIGPESADPDPATLAPEISLRSTGGQVEVIWKKDGMEALEIQKDSGSGWQFLATDTRPNYIDTTPFPDTAAKWKYRAIYTRDAQRTGQWSPVAEITVGG